MKSTHLRKNPSTCSASFKEIHLFLQSLIEGYFFILIMFHSKFNFINMSGFCGSVGLSGCCDEWVNMQSAGEERNAYRL